MINYLEKLQDKIYKLKRKRDIDHSPINLERLLEMVSQARNRVKEAEATYNVNLRIIHTHIVTNHLLAHLADLLDDLTAYEHKAFNEKQVLSTKLLAIRELADLINIYPQFPDRTNLNIQKNVRKYYASDRRRFSFYSDRVN